MVSAPDASPSAMLQVLDHAEATRHQNKLILRNAFNWRQLLKLVEELPADAHALNVCTLVHRLAKGEVSLRRWTNEKRPHLLKAFERPQTGS